MPANPRWRDAWDYPDCPECESNVFVRDATGGWDATHICELCGERFAV